MVSKNKAYMYTCIHGVSQTSNHNLLSEDNLRKFLKFLMIMSKMLKALHMYSQIPTECVFYK